MLSELFEGIFPESPRAAADTIDPADGLLRCGVCGQRKQFRTKLSGFLADRFGQTVTVPVMCDCQRMAIKAEEAARRGAERAQRIRRLRLTAITDEKYLACTFARDNQQDAVARAFCLNYVKRFQAMADQNIGLILLGEPGTGKSFYAASIANALVDEGIEAHIATLPELVHRMTAEFGKRRDETIALIHRVPLLVIDDFGVERKTSYGYEQIYAVVNERYKAQKPTVVTTNLTFAQLHAPEAVEDKRILARVNEMCPASVRLRVDQRAARTLARNLAASGLLADD